ncbi:MAG: hypothetical protein AMS18_05860 [Gemmatimonas sp. SG8_17]|nr:MAG: hypothetical protein AMS18_05860 [Gemmatimonas sp. SG8_17]
MRLPSHAIVWVTLAALATSLAVVPSGLSAQESESAAAACLGCHAANPQNPGSGIRTDNFAASVHAALGCRLCHSAGYQGFPHTATEEQKAGDCTSCHRNSGAPYHFGWIINEVRASVHGKMVSEDFACIECHDPHEVLPVHRAANMREAIANANRRCLECHGQAGEATVEGERHSLVHLTRVHSFLPRLTQHANSGRCVECHTPGREQTVHLILSARSAVQDCVECHTENSALLEKFYRHMAEEDRRDGFVNSVLLNNYYMVGATRNQRLDNAMWTLFGLSFLGICVHGTARLVTRRKRS